MQDIQVSVVLIRNNNNDKKDKLNKSNSVKCVQTLHVFLYYSIFGGNVTGSINTLQAHLRGLGCI